MESSRPPCWQKPTIHHIPAHILCTQWYLYYNNRFKFIIHNFISTKKMKIYIFAQLQPTSERAREPQNILGKWLAALHHSYGWCDGWLVDVNAVPPHRVEWVIRMKKSWVISLVNGWSRGKGDILAAPAGNIHFSESANS